jgi:hypothetical protein
MLEVTEWNDRCVDDFHLLMGTAEISGGYQSSVASRWVDVYPIAWYSLSVPDRSSFPTPQGDSTASYGMNALSTTKRQQ